MFALAKDAVAATSRGGASPVEDREIRDNSHRRVSRRAAVLMAGLLVVLSGVISQAPPASASAQPLIFFSRGSTVSTVTGESSSSEWANDGQSGNATGMASDGTNIFWAKGANVWRQPIDASSSPIQVVQAGNVGSGSFSIRAIDIDSEHIYMLGVDSGGVFHVARATKAGVLDTGWLWTTSNLVTGSDSLVGGHGLSVGPDSVFVTHTVLSQEENPAWQGGGPAFFYDPDDDEWKPLITPAGRVWKASKAPGIPPVSELWIVEDSEGNRGTQTADTPDQPLPITNDGVDLYVWIPSNQQLMWRKMDQSGPENLWDLFANHRVYNAPVVIGSDGSAAAVPILGMDLDPSTGGIVFALEAACMDPTDDPENQQKPRVPCTIFDLVSQDSNVIVDRIAEVLTSSGAPRIGGIVAAAAPAATPTINTSPIAVSVSVGDSASFSVVASTSDAGVLSYQWRKDGSDIAGAVGSTLSIPAVGLSDAGSYTVVVTNTLGASAASTTSTAANLTITAPVVTSASPASGSTDGGDTVTITGTGFAPGAAVTIGGSTCTSVTVVSPTSITCTTPAGQAGAQDVVVTSGSFTVTLTAGFTYVAAQQTTTTTTAPPVTTTAPPVTTAPAQSPEITPTPISLPLPETTEVPSTSTPVGSSTPTLVNEGNQETLTQAPGSATAMVNGQVVEVEVLSVADSAAAQTAPEDRSPEQVAELLQAAVQVVSRLSEIAGTESGITVVATETGAGLVGVFPDAEVPIEDVIVVDIDTAATLFAARDADGTIIEVQPGAVLEVNPDGEVAVLAFGLPTGDEVELVMMSTPMLLGTFTVDSKGSIETRVDLPDGIGAGDHTLVVASPNVQASLGLKVAGIGSDGVSSSPTLPAAGVSPDGALAVLTLAFGGLLVLIGRRRSERDLRGGSA